MLVLWHSIKRVAPLTFVACLFTHCGSPSAQQEKEPRPTHIVDKLSDSIARVVPTDEPAAATQSVVTANQATRMDTPASTKPTPPPKKEAWMDTLSDLTGVPAPNAAVLIDSDPVPLNLQSVAVLIAQRYRPKKPVEMTFRLLVTEAGTVRRYQLLRTSDPKLTVEYFAYPLMELRFSPATQGGKPVSTWTTISIKIPTEL